MTTSPVLSRILLYYGTVADVLFHYLVWLLDFIESTGGKLIEGLRIFVMAWSLNTVAAMWSACGHRGGRKDCSLGLALRNTFHEHTLCASACTLISEARYSVRYQRTVQNHLLGLTSVS